MATLLNTEGKLAHPTAADLQAADAVSEIICFTDGKLNDGTPYWAYLAVKPSKYASFHAATKARQSMMLSDYGRIIRYGNDAAVPAEEQEVMKNEYGFDDHYVEKLVKKAEVEQDVFLKQKEDKRLMDIVAMMKKNKPS
jgi:hypothetical protein